MLLICLKVDGEQVTGLGKDFTSLGQILYNLQVVFVGLAHQADVVLETQLRLF